MCPDAELLSAYFDQELDEVWETRIAEHVCHCAACQAKLSHFGHLSQELGRIKGPELEASMARSWKAIQEARSIRPVPIWSRRISIPIPVLAAAAAVFVAVFGLGIFLNLNGLNGNAAPAPGTQPVAVQQTEIAPVDFQVNNLNDLLNYLNSKDLGSSVVIQLPKGVDQLSVGKPQLIRAADFNRGQ